MSVIIFSRAVSFGSKILVLPLIGRASGAFYLAEWSSTMVLWKEEGLHSMNGEGVALSG